VVVRGADASGSIVVEKGSAEVSSQRRAPDQERPLLRRWSDRQRNRPFVLHAHRQRQLALDCQLRKRVATAAANRAISDLTIGQVLLVKVFAFRAGVQSILNLILRQWRVRHLTGLRFDKVANFLHNARTNPAPRAGFALRQILSNHTAWLILINDPTCAVFDLVSCFANRDVLRHEKFRVGPALLTATNGPIIAGFATYPYMSGSAPVP